MALTLAVGGVLAPTTARAATPDPTATVTSTSAVADEMSTYVRAGSGFAPNSTVTVAVTVGQSAYPGSYTKTHATDATGSFSGWNWIWTYGDPYGTYTFTFTDSAGHTASASIAITHTPTAPTPAAGTHLMLDTASAPALQTVRAWQQGGAPYTAIGVYIPTDSTVDNRHDKVQLNLDASWVSAVQAGGWHVVPIHVGLQAPTSCQNSGAFHGMSTDPATATAQGIAAADSAAARSQALGIDRSMPVMSDIEAYKSGCSAAIQGYLGGWVGELHRLGWHAGVYGGPSSVAKDLAAAHAADATYALPDVIWAATDNRHVSTEVSALPAGTWKIANQYLLGINRTYANTSLLIDETAVDDAVWTMGPVSAAPDTTPPVVTLGAAPWLVRGGRVSFAWSGIDAESGVASYEVRMMHIGTGPGSDAFGGTTTLPASATHTSTGIVPGERVCIEIRAVDQAGNGSAWTRPVCSTRLTDDRSATAGRGWKRLRQGSAYRKTVTVATRKKAVLTLGLAARGTRLAVVRSGPGPLVVAVNGHKVGVLKGNGTRSLVLPRAGKVTLTTSTAKKVVVDAYALVPGA